MRGIVRFLSGCLTLLVIICALAGAGFVWFDREVDAAGPLTEQRTIVIKRGEATRQIAERLERQGAISSQAIFLTQFMSQNTAAKLVGRKARQLKAGEYIIPQQASIREVIKTLTEGRAVLHAVTIPEGMTSYAVVQRLLADDNLSGEITEVPAEGSLLPETFRVPRNMDRGQIIKLLRAEQNKFLRSEWPGRQQNLPIKSVGEALVLASLVEKESGPNDEPGQIAGVFMNRLRKGMRLQSDPTILYGKFGGEVRWGSTIYRSDIRKKTKYNTYQIDGLPPTPIANPGRKAILAVLHPKQTKALYFVANGRGGHVFSETLEQHQNAVARWRKIEKNIRAEGAKAGAKGNKDKESKPRQNKKRPKAERDAKKQSSRPAPSPKDRSVTAPPTVKPVTLKPVRVTTQVINTTSPATASSAWSGNRGTAKAVPLPSRRP